MAQQALDRLPDYPKWRAEALRWPHLGEFVLARKLQKAFPPHEAINTWRTRIAGIRGIIEAEKAESTKAVASAREQRKQFVEEVLGLTYPVVLPEKKLAKKIDETKTVCISDPHEGYSDKRVWSEVLEKHHDAGLIHINGDIVDFYSQSRFRKDFHEDLHDELRSLFDRMVWLSTHWTRVTIIKGNHDNRVEKAISNVLPSDKLWMVNKDLIEYCASFFDNVDVVGERVYNNGDSIPINFLWQYQDILFTHIERSQKQSSSLMMGIAETIGKWSVYFRLKPYRWIVQGHNHRCSVEDMGNVYGMLIPMAADITGRGLQYTFNPALRGQPPTIGYAVFYTENGKTSFNKSRPYKIGE